MRIRRRRQRFCGWSLGRVDRRNIEATGLFLAQIENGNGLRQLPNLLTEALSGCRALFD